MDSEVSIYLKRAENELILAKTNFNISTKLDLKKIHGIPLEKTFFTNVISESYYSIFYSAKAYLASKNIKTKAPEEHKKTYLEFSNFVDSGELFRELVDIYDIETEKASVLLKIFFNEKKKRGTFVYNIKSEANIPIALESLANAKKFISVIKNLIEKK